MKSFESWQFAFEPVTKLIGNLLMLQDNGRGKPAIICEALYNDTPLWSLHYKWWFYMLFPLVIHLKTPSMRVNGNVSIWDLYWPLAYALIASLPLLALAYSFYLKNEPLSIHSHPLIEAHHLLSTVALVLLAFAWRKVGWVGFAALIGMFSSLAPISFSLYVIHYNSIVHASYFSLIEMPFLEWIL